MHGGCRLNRDVQLFAQAGYLLRAAYATGERCTCAATTERQRKAASRAHRCGKCSEVVTLGVEALLDGRALGCSLVVAHLCAHACTARTAADLAFLHRLLRRRSRGLAQKPLGFFALALALEALRFSLRGSVLHRSLLRSSLLCLALTAGLALALAAQRLCVNRVHR